jgi:HAD superfamily hydrolase (TIGR01549 family)
VTVAFDPRRRAIVLSVDLLGPLRTVTLRLLLDTGSAFTVVHPTWLQRAGYDLASPSSWISIATAGGVDQFPLYVISNVTALGFSDAVTTVHALREAGYRLAVATARPQSAAVTARELRELGLPDVFTAIVAAGEAGYRKPHPLIFESAARQLGVQSEHAVVVGDSYEFDIVPAASLAWCRCSS